VNASEIQRFVFGRADRVRVVRRHLGRAGLGVILAVAGCAATTITLRSNHFRLAVPPEWQVVEAGGGGEIPTLVRVPARDGAPEVDIRLYAWVVDARPADPSGDVLGRLAALNVLGLASARADDGDPCPDRAAQLFVFGSPARAIHLTNTEGRRIVVTAGEAHGSLVAVVGALSAGASGCGATGRMDAAVERLAAAMTPGADLSHPARPPTFVDPTSGVPVPPPNVDPTAPP
jgi:hypothetical protein